MKQLVYPYIRFFLVLYFRNNIKMSNTMSQIMCVLGEQMSNIDGNVVSSFTCACIDTMNRDDNQDKLKINVIDPLVKYMGKQIWPYVLFASILFTTITIALCICTLQIVRFKKTIIT